MKKIYFVLIGIIFFNFHVLSRNLEVSFTPPTQYSNNNYFTNYIFETAEMPEEDSLLILADHLFSAKKYAEALNIFKFIISNYVGSMAYYHAFTGIHWICVISAGQDTGLDFKELLEYVKAHTKDDTNAPIKLKYYYPTLLFGLEYYDEAMLEYKELLKIPLPQNDELTILNQMLSKYKYMLHMQEVLLYQNNNLDKEEILNNIKELELNIKEIQSRLEDIKQGIKHNINAISINSNNIDFGYVNIGSSRLDVLTITNTDNIAPLVIEAVDIDGRDVFKLLNNETPITIQAGGSKDLTIQFSPIAISDYTGKVFIRPSTYYNPITGFNMDIITVSLTGNGIGKGVTSVDEPTELPTEYSLLQNYPNPFNPTTTIQYTIPKDEYVKLVVYDITGKVIKELVNGYKVAGKYNLEFNASGYASGTYYYKIEAGEYKSIQKMMLIK